jgi:hypothetical protein
MKTLDWTVTNSSGETIAKLRHLEDAAALVALQGDGAKIRFGRVVLWREGSEDYSASESYDGVAELCYSRLSAHVVALDAKRAKRAATADSRNAKRIDGYDRDDIDSPSGDY